jgi:hypothetical protein
MIKRLLLLSLGLTLVAASGCSTPAYSARERANLIGRNWGLEWQQMQDDVDHALLLRPVSILSTWHVKGIGP